MLYFLLKFAHVIGAAVLLGTGAGIAFFMLLAHRDGRPVVVAGVARIVVIADFLFTATAVVAQPVTGVWLALHVGYPLTEGWILLSVFLYLLTGAFWLPVVRMQMRMRDLAIGAVSGGTTLPDDYHRLFRLWFAFGFPAFAAVLAIFWLMIQRPSFVLWRLGRRAPCATALRHRAARHRRSTPSITAARYQPGRGGCLSSRLKLGAPLPNSVRKSDQFRITTTAVAIAGAISSTPCKCCSTGATRRVALA
jgi:uncharacterized membrane protein